MTQQAWPERLYGLDVSRGIAALAVVLWHWKHFAYHENRLAADFDRESQPLHGALRLFYDAGALGVEYFFLLSGFVFFWLYRQSIREGTVSAWHFALQRFSRLYPLHLATLLLVLLLQSLYSAREGTSFVYAFNDGYHFLLNLFFASNWGLQAGDSFNGPIWSVSVEVVLYAIFFLVALKRGGGWLFCLAVIAATFGVLNVYYHPIIKGVEMFFIGGLAFHLTAFVAGQKRRLARPIYLITVLAWLGVFIQFYVTDLTAWILQLGMAGKIFLIAFLDGILLPLTVCSLALIEIEKGAFMRPVAWVGDITYSSYLLHFPLQLVCVLAVSYGMLGSGFYLDTRFFLAFFLVLIVASYLAFHYFERPMQRLIRSRLLQPRQPLAVASTRVDS